jgi:N-methylhydantoinase A/oxoprolinase/acetone carboxylase beta subunit
LKEFEREHQRRYGYTYAGREVELVTLRLRASVKSATAHAGKMDHGKLDDVGTGTLARPGRATLGSPSVPKAKVLFDGKKLATEIYPRETLTTVIPPGKRYHIDDQGNLLIAI